MRISAKEALETTEVKLSTENLLSEIYKYIMCRAKTGYKWAAIYKTDLFSETVTCPMQEKMFENATLKEIIRSLESLGYKVSTSNQFNDYIKITWNETD